ncbi:TetR/AcrR family transcriptional regulator [Kribbella kalugense]|uniref:TetR family transcriptional regulator n=1 Tax=Kribbella kalugense TaxID=2512221 RepID=A0A4R8A1H7_9ACTN|nr:TetR/AcrR family transcriptional regulator [Kribbella kalugense]TDW24363.1 TetR family transcriptional regulator [Kribbella kalugense]
MPRLSVELRDQRRRHVLVSAWSCFTRDGFHATSMDDIIAATGMSSSAVYRYVSGKDELVEAATEEALKLLRDLFTRLLDTDPLPTPAETVEALVRELSGRGDQADYDLSKIAVHGWAEALRSPEVEASTRAFYREVRANLGVLARRWQAAGVLPSGANPDHVAAALQTVMPGLIVNRHLAGAVSAEDLLDGLTALAVPTPTA